MLDVMLISKKSLQEFVISCAALSNVWTICQCHCRQYSEWDSSEL